MDSIIICISDLSQLKKFVEKIELNQSNNNFVFVVDIHSNDEKEYSKNYKDTLTESQKLKTEKNTVSVIFNSCHSIDKETLENQSQNSEVQVTCLGVPGETVLPLELFLSFFQNKVPTSDIIKNNVLKLLETSSTEDAEELECILQTYRKSSLITYESCLKTTNDLLIDSKHALLAIAYAEHYPENKENFLQVAKEILKTNNNPIKELQKELQDLLKVNPVEGGETNHLNLFTILKEHQNNAVILKKVLEYASAIGGKEGEQYFWRKAIEVVDAYVFEQILSEQNSSFWQESSNLSDLIRYTLSNRSTNQKEIITTIFNKAQDPETVFNIATGHLNHKTQKERLQKFYNAQTANSQSGPQNQEFNCYEHFGNYYSKFSSSISKFLSSIPSFSPCNCCAKPAVDTTNEVRYGPPL